MVRALLEECAGIWDDAVEHTELPAATVVVRV